MNIDISIFIGFLIFNLMVGLWYGRKVKTIKDYALGGCNFSTTTLVGTLVATCVSGSGFFILLSKTYSDGLPYVMAHLALSIQLLIIGVMLVPRMKQFLGRTSTAEVLGNLYGREVRVITAIAGAIGAVGGIAVQFAVFGEILNYALGINQTYSVFLAAAIIIIYSAFGGIKSVTYTDMLQFFTFGIIIPLIGIIIWNQLKDLGIDFTKGFLTPKFNYKEVLNINKPDFWQMIVLILYFAVPQMGQDIFQRISIGKNIKQVKKAFVIAALLLMVINFAISWIPFLIFNIDQNLNADKILVYIIDNYTYMGLKGLIIIAILSMSMSTADSDMNAASVLFSNDFCKSLNIGRNRELLLSRVFSLALGIFAVILALSKTDLLSIVLMANSFYMPLVTVPFIMLVFGFRTSKKSVLISMGAGFTTVIVWNILKIEMDCIVIAMLVNAIFLFGSHYLLKQEGGWSSAQYNDLIEVRKERRRKIKRIVNAISFANFITLCKRYSPKDEMMYTWLGIHFIVFTISIMYSTNISTPIEHGRLILYIYQIMMCTGVITAMYPIWPPRIKHEIIMQVAWNFIIFYMLIFFSGFFVVLSNFSNLPLCIFTINIIVTALLVGWKLSIAMIIAGCPLSIIFYKYYIGASGININIGSHEFVFMYSLLLVSSSLIIFLRPKQEEYLLSEDKNHHLSDRIQDSEKERDLALGLKSEFIRNIVHEYNAPLTGIISTIQILRSSYDKLEDKVRVEAINSVYESAIKLSNFDNNLSIISKLTQSKFKLSKKNLSLSRLIEERINVCRNLYESEKEKVNEARAFVLNIEQGIIYNGDKYYLAKLFDNLILNAITYCTKGKITIELLRDQQKLHFAIEDEGIGIPPNELYDVFAEFTVSSKTKSLAGGRGIGLTVCKKVAEAHGAKIKVESDGKNGTKFIIDFIL